MLGFNVEEFFILEVCMRVLVSFDFYHV